MVCHGIGDHMQWQEGLTDFVSSSEDWEDFAKSSTLGIPRRGKVALGGEDGFAQED